MTDYLEALLEHTDVLLEQVRRLERSGGRTGPASPAQPSPPLRRERDALSRQTGGAPEPPSPGEWAAAKDRDARQNRARRARTLLTEEDAGRARRARTLLAEEDAGREPGDIPVSPLAISPEREETVPPLLNQLKRLERTGVLPLGTASPGPEGGASLRQERTWSPPFSSTFPSGAGYPDAAGSPAPDQRGSPGLGESGTPPDGALGWAEQADRVFRRDSRRYDGGFYLY